MGDRENRAVTAPTLHDSWIAAADRASDAIDCATDGTCLVAWNAGTQIDVERIDTQGAPLGAARVVGSAASEGTSPWLAVERVGAGYLVLWSSLGVGVQAAPILDGADAAAPAAITVFETPDGDSSFTPSAASNGTEVVLAVGMENANAQSFTDLVRLGPPGDSLDAAPIAVTTGGPINAQIVARRSHFVLVWAGNPNTSYALRVDGKGNVLDSAAQLVA